MNSENIVVDIAVMCGGPGLEHIVSIVSTRNIIHWLQKTACVQQIHIIVMDTKNSFYYYNAEDFLEQTKGVVGAAEKIDDFKKITIESCEATDVRLCLLTKSDLVVSNNKLLKNKLHISTENDVYYADLVWPVFHGWGEDGVVQGFLEILNVLYIGCDVASSAVTFDKILTKYVCQSLPEVKILPFIALYPWSPRPVFEDLLRIWQTDRVFLKRARCGSSVDVFLVKDSIEFHEKITDLFTRTDRILVEKGLLNVRELECSFLGTGQQGDCFISEPGEVIVDKLKYDFYDYNQKYHEPNLVLHDQAKIEEVYKIQMRNMTKLLVEAFGCTHVSRVDFLLDLDTNVLYFNEINTIPGMTEQSLYPRMLVACGVSNTQMVEKLISMVMNHKRVN